MTHFATSRVRLPTSLPSSSLRRFARNVRAASLPGKLPHLPVDQLHVNRLNEPLSTCSRHVGLVLSLRWANGITPSTGVRSACSALECGCISVELAKYFGQHRQTTRSTATARRQLFASWSNFFMGDTGTDETEVGDYRCMPLQALDQRRQL